MVHDDGPMGPLDLDRMRAIARHQRDAFARAEPFPHLVVDDFLAPAVAHALVDEFPSAAGDWIFYHHVNERKRGFNDVAGMGPTTRAVVASLHGPEFLALTGETNLHADPSLEGGGLSDVGPGGYVNVHADFLSHSRERTWTRRLNLILFLNEGWSEGDGGALELWDAEVRSPVRRIAPVFNRCVVFATTASAFHGVPHVRCAAGRSRKSLALYYYSDDGAPRPIRSTHYVPRPGDPLATRLAIRIDRGLLHAYTWLKRHTPFGDRLASRLLKKL